MTEQSKPAGVDAQIEAKNIANILTKLNAGKVLSAAELETLTAFNAAQTAGKEVPRIDGRPNVGPLARALRPSQRKFAELVAKGKTQTDAYREAYGRPNVGPLARALRPSQRKFAELVAKGKTQTDAYREAYGRPNVGPQDAAERASRIAAQPKVREYINGLRERTEHSTLLTINERLKLLADNARIPSKTAAARNAQARAIEVYNKTAGDQAPERVAIEGNEEKPLHVVGRTATKAEKIAALLARRKNPAPIPAPA